MSAVSKIRQFCTRIDLRHPQHLAMLVLCFVGFHFLMWSLLATISQRAPHWDNMEELVWAQSFQWGYYKHPPFSTWWVHFWTFLFGRYFWVTYFAGMANVSLMLLIVWRIALLVSTPPRALIAVLFTSLIFYHGVNGIVADQNTLQLMPVALLLWMMLLGVREGKWWQWALAGVAAAMCVLTKYSAGIWFAVIGAWVLLEPRMRNWQAVVGVVLAIVVCVVLLIPHIHWLVTENYPTFQYANYQVSSESNHLTRLGRFLLSQLSRLAPLLIAAGVIKYALRRAPAVHEASVGQPEGRVVTMMALGPMVLTSLMGLGLVNLHANWAAAFFVLFGVYALRWLPHVDTQTLVRAALVVCLSIDVLMAGGVALSSGVLVDIVKRTARSNFPAAQLAIETDKIWDARIGVPMKLAIADEWLGGVLSVKSKYQPLIFLDAEPGETPWVRPELVAECGAFVLVDRGEDAKPPRPKVQALLDRAEHKGLLTIPWNRFKPEPTLKVEWAIVEPLTKGACPR